MCPLVLPAEQSGHYDDNGIDIDLIFLSLVFWLFQCGWRCPDRCKFQPNSMGDQMTETLGARITSVGANFNYYHIDKFVYCAILTLCFFE